MSKAITSQVESILRGGDFHHFGFTALNRPLSIDFYRQWLDEGMHGEMVYLKHHLPQKAEPTTVLPRARTAIVVAVPYVPHPEKRDDWPLRALRVAHYAKGNDYHIFLRRRLNGIIEQLAAIFPLESFLAMTDSHPVLERDLGHRAGLGWFAKNTCLLNTECGSLFFIAEIYTTLALEVEAKIAPDHCGTCQRCIEACPTGAIVAPKKLDARRCISYLTIEAKSIPDEDLRLATGSWFFGCDICQTVCPWNQKIFGPSLEQGNVEPNRDELIADLTLILASSNHRLNQLFKGTALLRAGPRGLKRNAILVAVHHRCTEVIHLIRHAGDRHHQLKDLVIWATDQLTETSMNAISQ